MVFKVFVSLHNQELGVGCRDEKGEQRSEEEKITLENMFSESSNK